MGYSDGRWMTGGIIVAPTSSFVGGEECKVLRLLALRAPLLAIWLLSREAGNSAA